MFMWIDHVSKNRIFEYLEYLGLRKNSTEWNYLIYLITMAKLGSYHIRFAAIRCVWYRHIVNQWQGLNSQKKAIACHSGSGYWTFSGMLTIMLDSFQAMGSKNCL